MISLRKKPGFPSYPILLALALFSLIGFVRPAGSNPLPSLVNGDFEENAGPGTIPTGWKAFDENKSYARWMAPRAQRSLGGIVPYSGKWMAAIDTEAMGVDTVGPEYRTPRAALCQTLRVPGGSRGVFRVRFNDIGSADTAHVSCLRLAVTFGEETLSEMDIPSDNANTPEETRYLPWSRPFFRVEKHHLRDDGTWGSGDWERAELAFEVPEDRDFADTTFWIGIFDNTAGTAIGYWRVDAAEVLWEGGD